MFQTLSKNWLSHKLASARTFIIHLFHVLLICNNVFVLSPTHENVNEIKWMQEVASQKEFTSHYSFNRTWCPSNRLPSSVACSGCADWVQLSSQSEIEVSCLYLLTVTCNSPHYWWSIIVPSFVQWKGIRSSPASCNCSFLSGFNNRKPSPSEGEVHSFHSAHQQGRTAQDGRLLIDMIDLLMACNRAIKPCIWPHNSALN